MASKLLIDFLSIGQSSIVLNIVSALVIIILGVVVGRLVGKLSRRLLHEFDTDRLLQEQEVRFRLESIVGTVFSFIIYGLSIAWALSTLGVTLRLVQIVIIIIVLITLGVILLRFKNVFVNFFSGIRLRWSGILKVGDKVILEAVEGRVLSFGILEATIETKKDEVVFVPNALLVKKYHK